MNLKPETIKELLAVLSDAQSTICRLKLSMTVHPDCTPGSEFDDYTDTAQEMEDRIDVMLDKVENELKQ